MSPVVTWLLNTHTLPTLTFPTHTDVHRGPWAKGFQMELQWTSIKKNAGKTAAHSVAAKNHCIYCWADSKQCANDASDACAVTELYNILSNWFGIVSFLLFHCCSCCCSPLCRYGISISWLSAVGLWEDLKTVPHFIPLQMWCICLVVHYEFQMPGLFSIWKMDGMTSKASV